MVIFICPVCCRVYLFLYICYCRCVCISAFATQNLLPFSFCFVYMKAKDEYEALTHELTIESQNLVDDKDAFLDAVFSEFCRTEQDCFCTLASLYGPALSHSDGDRHSPTFYSNGGAYSQFVGEGTPSSGNPLDDLPEKGGTTSIKYQHQAMHSESLHEYRDVRCNRFPELTGHCARKHDDRNTRCPEMTDEE